MLATPAPRFRRFIIVMRSLAVAVGLLSSMASGSHAQSVSTCADGGDLPPQGLVAGGQPDIRIKGTCNVQPGEYFYGKINIIRNGTQDSKLVFKERAKSVTTLWTSALIVEAGGALVAGVDGDEPFGKQDGKLTIVLYGSDQSNGNPIATSGKGATCVTPKDPDPGDPSNKTAIGPCGVPWYLWNDNGTTEFTGLPGGVKDYFYQYGGMYGDGAASADGIGYFGYKSIGVSYDGAIRLRGWKGTSKSDVLDGIKRADGTLITDPAERKKVEDANRTQSGTSWRRLARDAGAGVASLTLDSTVAGDWKADDQIVVTTTDYLPTHSEQRTITGTPTTSVAITPALTYPHGGTQYPIKARIGTNAQRMGIDPQLVNDGVEIRAAVALLTRGIRIVSGGDKAGETFAQANARVKQADPRATYHFGGHTVFRQGFRAVQVQGVEFAQLGQGGRLGHYPVHFHMVRRAPDGTYIKDSSVNESMTRWYVVHSTSNVLLARNVGYKSIGHGYYLESGTETDNRFHSNIGILARAAIHGDTNPLKVPGILAANNMGEGDDIRYTSDVKKPSVFWIMNGWNDFVGNMASGATACGACYWLLPGKNGDHTDVGHKRMNWKGYAASQAPGGQAGGAPLKSFYMNSCGSAMNSFTTVGDVAACLGFAAPPPPNTEPTDPDRMTPVRSIAPDQPNAMYYPEVESQRNPARCDLDDACRANPASCDPTKYCSSINGVFKAPVCSSTNPKDCVVTVLDRYTTSFNWGDFNFASVWLRSKWYLFDNGAVTDQLSGGLTFVSGGDYTRSSAPEGYWALAARSVFVGETNPTGLFTKAKGPLAYAADGTGCALSIANACVNKNLGVAYQLPNFSTSQRMFNIYDGPSHQDANAYLSIRTTPCTKGTECMYAVRTPGVRKDQDGTGFMPNAAIGWKQPNGFYYPPAFRSSRLLFDQVDIRHYLIEPLMIPGTYRTDYPRVQNQYINEVPLPANLMGNFTDVDRQTELTDNDGSLTGLVRKNATTPKLLETISVNKDAFFNAPIETDQCRSNLGVAPENNCSGTTRTRATAKTSPYEYLTTVVYPGCAVDGDSLSACGITPQGTNVCTDVPRDASKPELGTWRQCTKVEKRGGEWSKDCGGPFCFGVPIYRQYLIPPETGFGAVDDYACYDNPSALSCKYPFARMAGMDLFQRSIMTMNGGKYYLDTTISKNRQINSPVSGLFTDVEAVYMDCEADKRKAGTGGKGNCQQLAINEFKGNSRYYVFFVYARASTRQTYQIYVGSDFNPSQHLKVVRVPLNIVPFKPAAAGLTLAQAGWTANMITGPGGTKPDVLELTVDFKNFASELNPRTPGNGTCLPQDFCGWNGSSCECKMAANDPRVLANPKLMASCQQTCGTWAVQDIDCPTKGCLGFEFNLQKFVADDKNHRPTPTAFPTDTANFRDAITRFNRTNIPPDNAAPTASKKDSACYYAQIPGTDCPPPYKP